METNFLDSTRKLFRYYKSLGDQAMAQLEPAGFHHLLEPESNSIAVIVKHLSGNMRSRFTNFLHSDGEKPWRDRDSEFEADSSPKEEILAAWEQGWQCLFEAIDPLEAADLQRIVMIRKEGHTVLEALQRQLAHYAYHVGQMVFLAKAIRGAGWQSLSIPKGESQSFNREKFEQEPKRVHFQTTESR